MENETLHRQFKPMPVSILTYGIVGRERPSMSLATMRKGSADGANVYWAGLNYYSLTSAIL